MADPSSTEDEHARLQAQTAAIRQQQALVSSMHEHTSRRVQEMLALARAQAASASAPRVDCSRAASRAEYAGWTSEQMVDALLLRDQTIAQLQQQLRRASSATTDSERISATENQRTTTTPLAPDQFTFAFPRWYEEVPRGKTGPKVDAATSSIIRDLQPKAKAVKRLPPGPQLSTNIADIRDTIQSLFFKKVDKATLTHGSAFKVLAYIAQSEHVPWDIRSDATELFKHWAVRQVFDGDIMYGINEGFSLDKSYASKRLYKERGSNGLQNGQWWPYQICTMRDGAHGTPQGGIAGEPGRGAISIVISTHSPYADGNAGDVDRGEEIYYMGTPATAPADPTSDPPAPTAATQQMLDAYSNHKDIRVLRSNRDSSKAATSTLINGNSSGSTSTSTSTSVSTYAPEFGLRYDGLYRITDHICVDRATQHFRFHLRRNAGQDPIRCAGVERRPNAHEARAARAYARDVARMRQRAPAAGAAGAAAGASAASASMAAGTGTGTGARAGAAAEVAMRKRARRE